MKYDLNTAALGGCRARKAAPLLHFYFLYNLYNLLEEEGEKRVCGALHWARVGVPNPYSPFWCRRRRVVETQQRRGFVTT